MSSKNYQGYIDANHDKQALVFVVLDNENNADKIKDSLIKTASAFFPKRTITRDEYVYLWNHSIEVDNFTSAEIAHVVTKHCERDHIFTEAEVKEAYDSKKGNPLKDLIDTKQAAGIRLRRLRSSNRCLNLSPRPRAKSLKGMGAPTNYYTAAFDYELGIL